MIYNMKAYINIVEIKWALKQKIKNIKNRNQSSLSAEPEKLSPWLIHVEDPALVKNKIHKQINKQKKPI